MEDLNLFCRKDFIMRKKIINFLLILAVLFTILPTFPSSAAASESTELNIYAMYLKPDTKGDSVLLESKGHYLLIDLATSEHVPSIIKQLNALGATHVDVLFSHLHKDHVGGASNNMLAGLVMLHAAGITVDTLYVADPSIAPLSLNNSKRYQRLQNYIARYPESRIVYLNVGDHVSVGDADGEIIGPVNTSSITPEQYAGTPGSLYTASGNSIYTSYENNCSLAAIFICGTTRYFTAGDCIADEAKGLLERYGDQLHCDIMKLSHHGVSSGNSADLLKAISPQYSFASNSGYADIDADTGRWRTYSSAKRATKYGICYLPATEKKTLIYHIKNDIITLYKGTTVTSSNKVRKWFSVYGEDGIDRDHNMYYFDSYGDLLTGVQQIGTHYYYFDESGRMNYGTYHSGSYSGWRQYDTDKKRYFRLSENETYAYMSKGFDTIGGNKYYFDRNGYQLINSTDNILLRELGSNYYAQDTDNAFIVDDFVELEDGTYYFGFSGKMAIDEKKKIDDEYYLFNEDGQLITSDQDLSLYDFEGDTYAVYDDGTLVTNDCVKIDGNKYYFGSTGIMQTKKVIKIGKWNYYFGVSGKMIKDRKITWKGKKYYCKPSGVMKTIKKTTAKKTTSSKK
jgi:glucan-binding YG repeat protein